MFQKTGYPGRGARILRVVETWIFGINNYCWIGWFRNPVSSPVEVDSLSHCLRVHMTHDHRFLPPNETDAWRCQKYTSSLTTINDHGTKRLETLCFGTNTRTESDFGVKQWLHCPESMILEIHFRWINLTHERMRRPGNWTNFLRKFGAFCKESQIQQLSTLFAFSCWRPHPSWKNTRTLRLQGS